MFRVVTFCLAIVMTLLGTMCGVMAVLSLLTSGLAFWILSMGSIDILTLMVAVGFGGIGLLAGLIAVALCGAALESMDHALSSPLPA